MAFATKQSVDQVLPLNAGGAYRFWARGTGVVAGVVQHNGVPATSRVFLHAADGNLLGYRRTGADGVYEFVGLPPGEYRLVVEDDRETVRRSKIEHVIIPASTFTTRVGWRVLITAVDPASLYKGITELEFLGAGDVLLTHPSNAALRAIWSTYVNGSNTPQQAFDGNITNSGWLSYDNTQEEYIGWLFSVPGGPDIDVKKVAMRGSWNHPDGSPVDFQIQYTIDDGNWITAMTVTGESPWAGAGTRRVFTLP